MNKQKLLKQVGGLPSTLLDKRVLVDKSAILGLIDQLDEPQKVKIPKFVAEWIEYCKKESFTIIGAYSPVGKFGEGLAETFEGNVKKCTNWIADNQEKFARAWLEGYEEQEKLYTVEIPNKLSKSVLALTKVAGNSVLILELHSKCDWKIEKEFQLTEAEIKQDFDWAWQWAEEVE